MKLSWLCLCAILFLTGCHNGQEGNVPLTTSWQEVQQSAKDTPATDPQPVYQTYCNSRYGYCLDFTASLLVPQPEAANGDGRIFNDPGGAEILRVFGRINTDPDIGIVTLKEQLRQDTLDFLSTHTGRSIRYRAQGRKFYVFSGQNKDTVFYYKTISIAEGNLAFLMFTYREKDKNRFDDMVSHIAASFH